MKIIVKNIIYLLFYGLIISCNSDNNIPSVKNKYQDLVKIFQDFRVIQKPSITHGVPDYSPKAMAHQKAQWITRIGSNFRAKQKEKLIRRLLWLPIHQI